MHVPRACAVGVVSLRIVVCVLGLHATVGASALYGADLVVSPGGNLQQTIDLAAPGDVIVLQAGATYPTTGIILPCRSFGSVITIRSSAVDAIASPRWIEESDRPFLATIQATVNAPVVTSTCAGHWRFEGIDVATNPGWGNGEAIVIHGGSNLSFDRIRIQAPLDGLKRGIRGNGRFISLTRSRIAGVYALGQDSQCYAAWDGAGPHTITDNYLQCASENIMFGGADSSSAENVPADILIERNYVTKDPEWRALAGTWPSPNVKNLFELKSAKRVTVRDNVFEGNWADGQDGSGILFTARNQDGTAPWSVVSDVLFERNTVRSPLGFDITGYDDEPGKPSLQTSRITIRDNAIEVQDMAFLLMTEIGHLEIYRNTITVPESGRILSLTYEGRVGTATGSRPAQYAVASLVWADNVAPAGWIHSPTANGLSAFGANCLTYTFSVPTTEPAPQPEPEPIPEPTPEPEPIPTPLLTDAQRIDEAIAVLSPMQAWLSGKNLTNLRNILTRLQTLKGQVSK